MSQFHDAAFIQKDAGRQSAAYVQFSEFSDSISITGHEWDGDVFNSPAFSIPGSDLFIYSNGIDLYDQIGRKALNGDSIQVGTFEELILEFRDNEDGVGRTQKEGYLPINDSLIYMIHAGSHFIGLDSFEIDIVDPFGHDVTVYSNNLYLTKLKILKSDRVLVDAACKKKKILDANLVSGNLMFCKHGNGEDWWILSPEIASKNIYIGLLDVSTGEISQFKRRVFSDYNNIAKTIAPIIPSPDGQRIARFVYKAKDSIENVLELFSFDRCEGRILFEESYQVPSSSAVSTTSDIEWSENGRFLYMATGNEIVQIDFEEENYFMNRDTITVWDSFRYGSIPLLFGDMHRLPSGEILVGSFANSPYFDLIKNPNEKEEASNFIRRKYMGPPDPLNPGWDVSITSLPAWPPYHMKKLEGGCIVNVENTEKDTDPIKIVPNPTLHSIKVGSFNGFKQYSIYNQMGETVQEGNISNNEKIDVSPLASGLYYIKLAGHDKSVSFIKI